MAEYPRLLETTPEGETWEIDEDVNLERVHKAADCYGPHCTMHNPTDHHMRSWHLHWRPGYAFAGEIWRGFERICEHGIGHPDPDCTTAPSIHGCDGCCAPPDADL